VTTKPDGIKPDGIEPGTTEQGTHRGERCDCHRAMRRPGWRPFPNRADNDLSGRPAPANRAVADHNPP
jgi:hypothetical protein